MMRSDEEFELDEIDSRLEHIDEMLGETNEELSPNSAVRCEIFRPKEKEIVFCGVEQSEIVGVSPISTAAHLESHGQVVE